MKRKTAAFGVVVTLGYLIAVIVAVAVFWTAFSKLGPVEWANFLAGIFAPLAFLWLVLGFFQQGEELRNSAEALRLQGDELKASVEQQRELVEVTRAQLEHERLQVEREEAETRRKSQPRFKLELYGVSTMGINGGTAFTFSLANTGAECTDVAITAGDEVVHSTRQMRTGDSLTFEVCLYNGAETGRYPIVVTYVDFLRLPGRVDYDWFVEGSGTGFAGSEPRRKETADEHGAA